MTKGTKVITPRFGTVTIEEVFESRESARDAGYTEPTYFDKNGYKIVGKSIGINRMIFAAYANN